MNIRFTCPRCSQAVSLPFDDGADELACGACGQAIRFPPGALEGGRLRRCLVCPSVDLFARKAFPQRVGLAIVIAGFAASCVTWGYRHVYWTFAILFATALADLVLYFLVGNGLMCYRCHAEYRGVEGADEHAVFDLETHERYRQLEARTSEHQL